jgi:hypothetical protein
MKPTVNTRCIYHRIKTTRSDSDNLTLCPIVDFANHRPSPPHMQPRATQADIFDVAPRARLGEPFALLAPAGQKVQAGDELFLQYGKHSNRSLFVEYGFVNHFADGDIAEGRFEGDVNLQDIMEELFQSRGPVGEWMTTILREEGYWA